MVETPETAGKFPASMRLLHWLMASLIIGLLAIGILMADIPLDSPDKFDLYPWHRAFGILAFVLVIIRLIVRFRSSVPAPPAGIKWYERRAAQGAQIVLYGGMLILPPLGYCASSAVPEFPGIPVLNSIWFFGLELPRLPMEKNYDTMKFFITIHKYVGYAMIAVIFAHVAGALKHRYFDKPENDVLSQMM